MVIRVGVVSGSRTQSEGQLRSGRHGGLLLRHFAFGNSFPVALGAFVLGIAVEFDSFFLCRAVAKRQSGEVPVIIAECFDLLFEYIDPLLESFDFALEFLDSVHLDLL